MGVELINGRDRGPEQAKASLRLLILALEEQWAFIAATLYTALAVSIFGHTIYFVLIRKYEANLIAALTLMCPLMAIGLGVIITGDAFDARMAAGTVIVLAGVLLIFLAPRRAGLTSPKLEKSE